MGRLSVPRPLWTGVETDRLGPRSVGTGVAGVSPPKHVRASSSFWQVSRQYLLVECYDWLVNRNEFVGRGLFRRQWYR